MICFPNAKINLGLRVTERRPDGFHNIETVFYPIGIRDVLEAVPSDNFSLHLSGIAIGGDTNDNLVAKAWRQLSQAATLSPMAVYLHKAIPFGAGIGGGSADAAFLLKLVNEAQNLGFDDNALEVMAAQLGADCSFFIRNKGVYAHGKGEIFEPINLSLKGYYLVLVKPGIFVSTAEAYRGVMQKAADYRSENPSAPGTKPVSESSRFHSTTSLPDLLEDLPISEWKHFIVNDFEYTVFPLHPEIAEIKDTLYSKGALYASMSGSGSSVFGIFPSEIDLTGTFPDSFVWSEVL